MLRHTDCLCNTVVSYVFVGESLNLQYITKSLFADSYNIQTHKSKHKYNKYNNLYTQYKYNITIINDHHCTTMNCYH